MKIRLWRVWKLSRRVADTVDYRRSCPRAPVRPACTCHMHTRPSHTVRYDTRCCLNVRSKADMSQLNLLDGTDIYKWKEWELKSKKRISSEVSVTVRGIRESVLDKKRKATVAYNNGNETGKISSCTSEWNMKRIMSTASCPFLLLKYCRYTIAELIIVRFTSLHYSTVRYRILGACYTVSK